MLDSYQIPNAFLDIVTESLSIRRRSWAFVATLSSFVGNREIKTSNKTKEEIVDGFSLRVTTPSRACEPVLKVKTVFASKGYPFNNIFDFTTAGDWDCVAAVKRLPALHYSVDLFSCPLGSWASL